ncbi:hypothetical protein SAMN04488028_101383 [Reichenbachiella agariperforans]|uniref:Uncharacterized protein n=1 Tax=Reichenbachiella agariperforans TaxID=156994 RepID=A0A1M6JZG3_REIAG|nr:hypothetical protein [Reichenbachiella agariperforans]SHJ52038.1 hypothetical protein SAMN04488028_101383 [Reichenbachiella agariperforans]
MNKQKFIELVGAADQASELEIKALEKLVQQYPFFQNGHVVLAKASKAKKLPSTPKRMSTAAVYATNRAVFKQYLLATSTRKTNAKPSPTKVQQTTKAAPSPSTPQAPTPATGNLDKFIEEVYSNLENWKSSRESYLEYEKNHPEEIVIKPVDKKIEVEKEEEVDVSDTVEQDIYEQLKKQVADEVNAEEAKATPISRDADQPITENNDDEDAFKKELESIEAQVDAKVEEVKKSTQDTPAESEEENPEAKIPKEEKTPSAPSPVEPEKIIPESSYQSSSKSADVSDGPDIEEIDANFEALENEIAQSAPEEKKEEVEDIEDSKKQSVKEEKITEKTEEVPTPTTIIPDDESDTPVVDESVVELEPEMVYNFNSPIPVPQEAPENLSKKTIKETKKEENLISSEELSQIVDKVSEEVEAEENKSSQPNEISSEVSEKIEAEIEAVVPHVEEHEEEASTVDTPKKTKKESKAKIEDPSEDEIAESENLELTPEPTDEDLENINQERSSLKLVPGASRGDKKFRLAILKRPHNFTKPKREEGIETKQEKEPAAEEKLETKKPVTKKVTKTKEPTAKKKTATETKKPATKKATSTAKKTTTKKAATTKKTTTKKTEKSTDTDDTDDKKKSSLKSSPKFRVSASIKTSKKLTSEKPKSKKKTNEDSEEDKKKTTKINKEKAPKDTQNSIIDSFIESNPSIKVSKGAKSLPENTEDLSSKSTAFPEEVITENLAAILTAQGKTLRAIEIYQKLILKNPQKKAYFASQIEKLNKL